MAEVLSILSCIGACLNSLALVNAAIYSSAYDKAFSLSQETQQLCDSLKQCRNTLEALETASRNTESISEITWPALRGFRALSQEACSKRTILALMDRNMLGGKDSGVSDGCLEVITERCRQQLGHSPIFWRLQSWITVSFTLQAPHTILTLDGQKNFMDILPPSSQDALTTFLKTPSPQVLLLSWLILAIAVSTLYRTHSKHGDSKPYLVGGILVAFVLGWLEGSGMTTVILTYIPWCLTVGALAQLAMYTGSELFSGTRKDSSHHAYRLEQFDDMEKIAGKV